MAAPTGSMESTLPNACREHVRDAPNELRPPIASPECGRRASVLDTLESASGTIAPMAGVLFCGDNLDVLGEYIPDASVDLIYADPPFNSNRTYNLVYKDSPALHEAFKDHWSWDEAAPNFSALVSSAKLSLALRKLLQTLHDVLVEEDSDLLAYLTMMAPRLVAMRRVLKPTGSMYLHCDPTASHYLKVLLDAIFGSDRMLNEIVWKRTTAHSKTSRYAPVHDVILFFSKSPSFVWNDVRMAYEQAYLDKYYKFDDGDGRLYWRSDLTAAGVRAGSSGKPWRGIDPSTMGRHWAIDSTARELVGDADTLDALDQLDKLGRIYWPPRGTKPQYKRYREDLKGKPVTDVWDDIDRINPVGSERLGYPTQKPLALLERILRASTEPGDLVLDPFCGCGTTVEAAEKLGRRWIGIDIARKAVEVIETRFKRANLDPPTVIWHPADRPSAEALADRDKTQFEKWARRKVHAAKQRKKDRGIDGEALFKEPSGKTWHVLLSVKGGRSLAPSFVRDLRGTIEREKAAIGVLVSLVEPTKEMRHEAARAGFLDVRDAEGPIPRLQLVTVDRLFSDKPAIRAPGVNVTEVPKPTIPPPLAIAPEKLPRTPANTNARGATRPLRKAEGRASKRGRSRRSEAG